MKVQVLGIALLLMTGLSCQKEHTNYEQPEPVITGGSVPAEVLQKLNRQVIETFKPGVQQYWKGIKPQPKQKASTSFNPALSQAPEVEQYICDGCSDGLYLIHLGTRGMFSEIQASFKMTSGVVSDFQLRSTGTRIGWSFEQIGDSFMNTDKSSGTTLCLATYQYALVQVSYSIMVRWTVTKGQGGTINFRGVWTKTSGQGINF